jgi:hypothetical protein
MAYYSSTPSPFHDWWAQPFLSMGTTVYHLRSLLLLQLPHIDINYSRLSPVMAYSSTPSPFHDWWAQPFLSMGTTVYHLRSLLLLQLPHIDRNYSRLSPVMAYSSTPSPFHDWWAQPFLSMGACFLTHYHPILVSPKESIKVSNFDITSPPS